MVPLGIPYYTACSTRYDKNTWVVTQRSGNSNPRFWKFTFDVNRGGGGSSRSQQHIKSHMHNIFRKLILILLHDLCKFRTVENFFKTQIMIMINSPNYDQETWSWWHYGNLDLLLSKRSQYVQISKNRISTKKWFNFEGVHINMNSVNAVIKATELHVTVNFDIGRKCIFNLQFTTGSRGRVEEF